MPSHSRVVFRNVVGCLVTVSSSLGVHIVKVTRPGRDKSLHWAHGALKGHFSVKWMSSQAEEVGGWVTVLSVQEKAPRTAPVAPLPAVTGVG